MVGPLRPRRRSSPGYRADCRTRRWRRPQPLDQQTVVVARHCARRRHHRSAAPGIRRLRRRGRPYSSRSGCAHPSPRIAARLSSGSVAGPRRSKRCRSWQQKTGRTGERPANYDTDNGKSWRPAGKNRCNNRVADRGSSPAWRRSNQIHGSARHRSIALPVRYSIAPLLGLPSNLRTAPSAATAAPHELLTIQPANSDHRTACRTAQIELLLGCRVRLPGQGCRGCTGLEPASRGLRSFKSAPLGRTFP